MNYDLKNDLKNDLKHDLKNNLTLVNFLFEKIQGRSNNNISILSFTYRYIRNNELLRNINETGIFLSKFENKDELNLEIVKLLSKTLYYEIYDSKLITNSVSPTPLSDNFIYNFVNGDIMVQTLNKDEGFIIKVIRTLLPDSTMIPKMTNSRLGFFYNTMNIH